MCLHTAQMKLNLIALLVTALVAVISSGCYSTPDGRMKVGVPMAKDTIENRYKKPKDQIFAAAKEVLKVNGTLASENTIHNIVEARIDTKTVWVQVDEVEPQISRVRVTARNKGGTADIDLASEIATQIALRLK